MFFLSLLPRVLTGLNLVDVVDGEVIKGKVEPVVGSLKMIINNTVCLYGEH